MKYYILLLCLSLSLISFAQKVEKDGKVYEVKLEKIYLDGVDVTETLKVEEKQMILKQAAVISDKLKLEESLKLKAKQEKAETEKANALKEAEKVEKEAQKLEKEAKKAEKAQKKAEKGQKKAEKALKKKEKLQSNLEKAEGNLEKAQNKYEKLKRKGKLSPVDEGKWLDKLDKLTDKLNKAKSKI